MNKFNVSQPYLPNQKGAAIKKNDSHKQTVGNLQRSFNDHLHSVINDQTVVKFSHHAQVRLKQHGVELSSEQLDRMNEGLKKAKEKGAKESLVLMDDYAFVLSVKNDTVITAMKQNGMEHQVVTNIDSAVIL